MADKFFHEFPTTTTLKDDSILLLDQDKQTTAITLAQLKSFLGSGSSGTNYTTVGNASAGIFVKAECFVNGENGIWTAPDGVYTARVTVVGGGGRTGKGGRSHFNCPTGFTTIMNQIFANGGTGRKPTDAQYGGNGGGVAWNGINNHASDGNGPAGYSGPGGGLSRGTIANGGYGYGGNAGSHGNPSSISTNTGGGTSIICRVYGILGNINGAGGGANTGNPPEFSYAAALNNKFVAALRQNNNRGPGCGAPPSNSRGGGGGAGWATALVSIEPKKQYTYAAGIAESEAGYGMVLIEY